MDTIAAIAETTNFLHYFRYLPDHRQAGKVDYPLAEILLCSAGGSGGGGDVLRHRRRFGERKIELLRRFGPM